MDQHTPEVIEQIPPPPNALAPSGGALVSTGAPGIADLLRLAIERGVPVETMERLLAMQEKMQAAQAKALYIESLAAFQGECPEIAKTKQVFTRGGDLAYSYAPLESIVHQVAPLLTKHGLSYRHEMELKAKEDGTQYGVLVLCHVTHVAGHTETTPMEVPLGQKTQVMNDSQVVAAATTFAKRYSFLNAFGIMTADDDSDGRIAQQQDDKPSPRGNNRGRNGDEAPPKERAAEQQPSGQQASKAKGGRPKLKLDDGVHKLYLHQLQIRLTTTRNPYVMLTLSNGTAITEAAMFQNFGVDLVGPACELAGQPTPALADGEGVAFDPPLIGRFAIELKGQYLNVRGVSDLAIRPAAQHSEPEQAKKTPPPPKTNSQSAPAITPAPDAKYTDDDGSLAPPLPAESLIADSTWAELLYHRRRVKGDATWDISQDMLGRAALKVLAGLGINTDDPRRLPGTKAAEWLGSLNACPTCADYGERPPFCLADARDYVRGTWNPEIGDLGEPLNMDSPLSSGD